MLGFKDTSAFVDHFVSSPREREKRDRRDSRGDERVCVYVCVCVGGGGGGGCREERGTGIKVKKQKK